MQQYNEYSAFNRYENIDGIEAKIVNNLVLSQTKHADCFWKILKYNDISALSQPTVSRENRIELVSNDNGETTNKRVFMAPFVDDAWEVQCSSVYIFVETIEPIDHMRATIGVTVETVVHSKISVIAGDGDPILNPDTVGEDGIITKYGANPNDSDSQGSIVVPFKNRATVLLKCILAELNGMYIDGVGYLQLNNRDNIKGMVDMPLFNRRSFYGHSIKFKMVLSGISDTPAVGY